MKQIRWCIVLILAVFNRACGSEALVAMSQHSAEQAPQHHLIQLNLQEKNLVQSYQAHCMAWLPALYEASGLSQSMSKECFMVHALREIKKAITDEQNRLAILKAGAYLGGESLTQEERDGKDYLCAANFFVSGLTLLSALLYWGAPDDIQVSYPPSIRLTPVQTSCARLYYALNETWGWDNYKDCWYGSLKLNTPCNATALGQGETSFCCWARFDPECNRRIINYMNNTYPVLYEQAQRQYHNAKIGAGIFFYTAAPTIVTLNLLFQLARYKYRSMIRAKAQDLVCADEQPGLSAP